MPKLLPTLPNMVQGIVAVETRGDRKIYTLQCQGCWETEQPWPLVLMTFKFCPTYDKNYGRTRYCPACRLDSLLRQGWTETEARRIITDGHPR